MRDAFALGLSKAMEYIQNDRADQVNFEAAILQGLNEEAPEKDICKRPQLNGYGPPRDKVTSSRSRGANLLWSSTPRQTGNVPLPRENTWETHAQVESYPKYYENR